LKKSISLFAFVFFVGLQASAKLLECSAIEPFYGRTLGVSATIDNPNELRDFKIGALTGRAFEFNTVFSVGARSSKLDSGIPGFEGSTHQFNLGQFKTWTYFLVLDPSFFSRSQFGAVVIESVNRSGDGGILNELTCNLR
jgi:hypothetical protein